MNAGDLISLLLVLLFVASAFFGRGSNRTGTGGERPPRRPDTVDEEPARERPAPEAPPRRSEGSGPARAEGDGGGPGEDLRKRLEEARRRVREAASGEGEVQDRRPSAERGGTLAGGGGPGPDARAPSEAPAPQAPGRTAQGPGRPGGGRAEPRRTPSPREARGAWEEASSPWQQARRDPWAARTQARRADERRSARLSAAELLDDRPRSVVRGYVWSVILSEPAYPSTLRRKVSRRRSP